MWCLGKFLPLVIGSSIPNDDEKWQHYLLLLRVVDIVFSPAASVDDLQVFSKVTLRISCGSLLRSTQGDQ